MASKPDGVKAPLKEQPELIKSGSGTRLSANRASRGVHNALAGDEAANVGPLQVKSTEERGEDDPLLLSKLLAEFMGTFFLVFTVGVSVHSGTKLAPAAIGLVLAIQIYTYASVSGGMFNPAVTLAVLVSGRDKIKPEVAAMYIGTQLFAGVVAGLLAFGTTDMSFGFDWEETPAGGAGTSFVLEAIYTAALCSTVLASGTSFDAPNQYYGFAIGLTVMSSAWTCGGFDQGSFNPAVTLGINLGNAVNKNRSRSPSAGAWFLFLLTPFLGSLLAAGIFRLTRGEEYQTKVKTLAEKLLAEFVGTFYLVLTVGVAVAGGGEHAAVAIGMMLGIQIFTYGSVSGACFNPAVTIAVLLSGRDKMPPLDAALYLGSQFLSALIAGFVSFGVTDKSFCFDYKGTEGGAGSSFFLETIFTLALCTTVLTSGTSLDAPNHYFGFAIGMTVTVGAAACGKFDQGSFNPAVTVGMNFGNYANKDSLRNPSAGAWFLFLLTPFCGSILAAGIFRATRTKEFKLDDKDKIQVGMSKSGSLKGSGIGNTIIDRE